MTESAEDRVAEMERIEVVLLDALNSLHRLRRAEQADVAPAKSEWVNVAVAAHRLQVSETTAWRLALRYGANWPQNGVRLVDYTRLRRVRPPRG